MTKQTEALRLAIKNMEQCDMGITILLEGLAKFGVPKDILRLDKESVLVPAIKACKDALVENIHQAKLDAYNSASSRLYKEALAKTYEAEESELLALRNNDGLRTQIAELTAKLDKAKLVIQKFANAYDTGGDITEQLCMNFIELLKELDK